MRIDYFSIQTGRHVLQLADDMQRVFCVFLLFFMPNEASVAVDNNSEILNFR